MIERTFVMLKPDAVQRGLMGEIVARFEAKGYKPVAMKLMRIPRELAERHYGEHKGKGFFNGLIDYITSGPVLAMVWEGENIVADMRVMMGKTNPRTPPLERSAVISRSRQEGTSSTAPTRSSRPSVR